MKKILSLFIILTSIILASCEDIVDVDLNETDIDLVAVEAYINTKDSDNIFVKLEKSLPVTKDEENPPVNNAIVEISDDQPTPNKVLLTEIDNSGIYKLSQGKTYSTIPGRTYKLMITTPDGIIITGEEHLQKVENLDLMKIHLSARGNFEFLAVFINSQETPGKGQFYKWDIYKNGKLMHESENMAFANDEIVDGNYIYDLEIYTDFPQSDDYDLRKLNMGDTVYVEQLSISENAYDFYYAMINQAYSGNPFSVPPANLPGNLTSSNGKRVLGLFSARDISASNSVIIDSNNYTPLTSGLR